VSKRHDAVFDDVLRGLSEAAEGGKSGARFLKRQNALAESGQREEKVLRWVDPASCIMWERHNRVYGLLSEDNCCDLIDSLKAQGRQEFPAIVRKLPAGRQAEYEVICGARRHFAVSWLRANNYPQFLYLVEIRDLTDEEAFRLADLENRDRADLSDYERAADYQRALELYYGGKQKAMAARLEVSEAWLSRYLHLARLPHAVVEAWPQITHLRELHARSLRSILSHAPEKVLAEAAAIAAEQAAARRGQGSLVPVPRVLARLQAAARGPKPVPEEKLIPLSGQEGSLAIRQRGNRTRLEFPQDLPEPALRAALQEFLDWKFRPE
jgi:ParB family chromosome partitioning protein